MDKPIFVCVDGVLMRDGRMLLLKRAVEPFKGWWHVAGGHVDEDESLRDALKREFWEETGLDVEVGDVVCARVEETADRVKLVVAFAVVCPRGEVNLNEENGEFGWFRAAPPKTVYDYFGLAAERQQTQVQRATQKRSRQHPQPQQQPNKPTKTTQTKNTTQKTNPPKVVHTNHQQQQTKTNTCQQYHISLKEKTLHIAQIGTGRVGRPTAYTIMTTGLADTLTVCDTKPGLAAAFAEELKHVTASTRTEVEINSCERDEQVSGADIILISAGEPRAPGVKMTRRDLAVQNARIVKAISEATAPRNRAAKYIVISNPVDAMAMVCKKYAKADFVISTGTNLESLRFRSRIAQCLNVPISRVEGWVGGEHGDAAIPLWSTTKISNKPADEFAKSTGTTLQKTEIESYVKTVSKQIVDNIGGTEFGPAASFRDITRAIVKNTNEVLSIAAPKKFPNLPAPVFVGYPTKLGTLLGDSLYSTLSQSEQEGLAEAARAIYQTYQIATEKLEQE